MSYNSKAKNYFKNTISKTRLIELYIVIFIISTNFIIGFSLRPDIMDVVWIGDDAWHVIVANNFREEGNFMINFRGEYIFWDNSLTDTIEQYPEITSSQGGKGPLYFVLLGSVYSLFNTPVEDLHEVASYFSNLLSSIFLVLFFFLIKKKFDLKIAFLSSILLLFLPFVGFHSVFARPMVLLYIFSFAAFFFFEKKNLHYVLFGLFIGLAHLTHPFALILGISYSIFLLINKEFKGFLISFITWQLVLIPWFWRNYITFGDIGTGLFIPFSDKISQGISFLLGDDFEVFLHPTSSIFQSFQESDLQFELFDILSSLATKFSVFYTMDLILVFLIVFAGLYFFKIEIIKEKTGSKKLYFFILILSIILAFIIPHIGFYSQLILVFAIPPIVLYFLWMKNKELFIKIPRFSLFIVLFGFVSLISLYATAIILNYPTPDPYQIMFSMFLLIPLAIVGLNKTLNLTSYWKEKTRHDSSKKYQTIIILLLVISPILIQSSYGIDINKYAPEFQRETDGMKSVKSLIINNSFKMTNIATNEPLYLTYKTNVKSVPLPTTLENFTEFNIYLEHYDVNHLVFYNLKPNFQETYDALFMQNSACILFQTLHNPESSRVIYKKSIIDVEISQPDLYLMKGQCLLKSNSDDANKIFSNIHNLDFSLEMTETLCELHSYYKMYDEVDFRCNQLLEINRVNTIALNNLLISELYYGETDKALDKYSYLINQGLLSDKVNDFIIEEETIRNSWPDFIRLLINLERYDEAVYAYDSLIDYQTELMKISNDADSYETQSTKLIEILKSKTQLFNNLGDDNRAFRNNLEIIQIDKFDLEVWLEIAEYHEKTEHWQQALVAYEFINKLDSHNEFILEKIEELKLKIENK